MEQLTKKEKFKRQSALARVNRMTRIIRTFYFLQFFVVGVGLVYYLFIALGFIQEVQAIRPSIVLGLLIVMLLGNGYFIFRDKDLYKLLRFEADSRESAFHNIEKLNRDLRAQRHDFLNHIQVLYSLMELEEYEETTNYLNHLYGDIIKVGSRIKTRSVSINALLQAKSNEAEKKNITFDILLKSKLDQLPIGEWEFCRILGNLIDNAFEALKDAEISQKVVTIQIYEGIKNIDIRVRNNGPFIPENMTRKIFEPGVSSKEDKEDHGMGLFICKQLLEDNGHKLVLEQEGDVCFHITLNK